MKKVGIRIDVDTFRGTREGIPRLLKILNLYNIQASIFFSVGPDNMGRHIWRLIKPSFLRKFWYSKAISLYGWKTLFSGTAWPGKLIGKNNKKIIQTAAIQHEIGLHAWDHHAWQLWSGIWSLSRIKKEISRGLLELNTILNTPVTCSAAAGWRADQRILLAKENFTFRYNSDCRGTTLFRPLLNQNQLGTVQIPVTLPTWDEIVGTKVSKDQYNSYIIDRIHKSRKTSIYTIHAEVEGMMYSQYFIQLLNIAKKEGIQFCSLGELLPKNLSHLPISKIVRKKIIGREGWIGYQEFSGRKSNVNEDYSL